MPMEAALSGSNKEQIIIYFKTALKALEEDIGDFDEDIESNDDSNALCWSIEAMFLHGMKNSKPNKDFWPIIKRFSHKSSLETVKSFDQIRSDIGRCRSWLRLSINECCLESYLSVITGDVATLCRYYLPTAFLLDEVSVDSIMILIKGLSKHQFKLSCNSTLHNQWNLPPLQLAGLISDKNLKWPQTNKPKKPSSNRSPSGSASPSIAKLPLLQLHLGKSPAGSTGHLGDRPGLGKAPCQSAECLLQGSSPVAGGHRHQHHLLLSGSIPSSLEKDNVSLSSSTSRPDFVDARHDLYRTVYDISESEEEDAQKTTYKRSTEEDDFRFKVIIQNNLEKYPLNYDKLLSQSEKEEKLFTRQMALGLPLSASSPGFVGFGQALSTSNSPSAVGLKSEGGAPLEGNDKDVEKLERVDVDYHSEKPATSEDDDERLEGEATDRNSSGDGGLITIEKIIASVIGGKPPDLARERAKERYEIQKNNRHESSRKDFDISQEYAVIKHEKGLSSQCFQCKSCSAPIGVFFGKERVCSFDKCYYCPECLDKDEEVIPNRVVFNWDFRQYKVSKGSFKALRMYKATPIVNIENLNPSLYSHVPALNDVKTARIRLKFLKTYLLNCNLNHVINMHSFLGDLSHYAEDVHSYSMEDLLRVPSGNLLKMVNRACQFGIDHVSSCHLCSQKGFYCEICRGGSIIYPFDLENTFRCGSCKAVYHRGCKTSSKACPKCQRRARKNSSCSDNSAMDVERESSRYIQESINFSYATATAAAVV